MKTKRIGAGSATIAILAAAVLFCHSLFCAAEETLLLQRKALRVENELPPTVIIDAGHGGMDSGAVGINGVLEKDLNLAIAKTLADMLRLAGVNVIETRTDDRLLADPLKPHKKRQDLGARLALTREYPSSVLISIHMNTFPLAECHGLQVWYSPNNEDSAVLAKAVQDAAACLEGQGNRKIKCATSSIFLLKHTTVPAILVECGFISNPSECARLCSVEYQKEVALLIFEAIFPKLQKSIDF